jgi:hypothetical protein
MFLDKKWLLIYKKWHKNIFSLIPDEGDKSAIIKGTL